MKKYLLVYRGAVRPEDGKKHMTQWLAWVHGLGDSMVDPGIPVGPSQTVSSEGVNQTITTDPVSGISILQAENLTAALALIKPCPHLSIGGTIEVAEAMDMSMS